jgi:muramidase (phage lysozyme)
MAPYITFICLALVCAATPVLAERQSLFPLGASRSSALLQREPVQRGTDSSSLFAGIQGRSFFAPLPDRPRAGVIRLSGSSPIAQLLSLIAIAEAGSAGYDAVQYGATIRPSKRPTDMTLGEIYAWIDATPGQPHAIGRYQFIPPTLREVAARSNFGPGTRFSQEVQDQLALVLLDNAGLAAFQGGQMQRDAFMGNLARIWAGLPLPSGRSYYEGYAGNSAAMSWTAFEAGMARIFPFTG